MAYFSQRNKPYTSTITEEFWNAFKAYIEELCEKGWFYKYSKFYGNFYDGRWVVDISKLNRKMAQEIGKRMFPLNEMPDDETIVRLIEFFFKIVSKPISNKGPLNIYDDNDGRYEYTIRINNLFQNYLIKYELRKGKVTMKNSEIFDDMISKIDFVIPDDEETMEMLSIALKKFYSRNFEERKIALEKLVDAYQRISSWEDKENKKKSVEKILSKITQNEEEFKDLLGKDVQELWEMANKFMIRHTETDKIPIKDEAVLEYLFYAYFNTIRFILKKYGYLKENKEDSNKTEEKKGIDDLPF